MLNKIHRNGFTLVELLVVIAIIAILFAVVLIAINPAQRFKDSRNARRLSDVGSIVGAVTTYTADKRGVAPADIPDYQCVGTKTVQDFQSTAPTDSIAFWRMDDSGAPLVDVAGTANNLTATNIDYNVPGKIGSAIKLKNDSLVATNNQAELNPSAAITIETWLKLGSEYSKNKQLSVGLIDKGTYRLEFDHQSNSLLFELDNNAAEPGYTIAQDTSNSPNTWYGINAFAAYKNKFYAGIATDDDSTVKLYSSDDGSAWSLVSSLQFTPEMILSLMVYDDKLFVGFGGWSSNDGKIYSFDGADWKLEHEIQDNDVRAMTIMDGKLYVGGGGSYPKVFEYDGNNWRDINFSYTINYGVYALKVYRGKLYVGTGGTGGPELRRWDGGSNWTSINIPNQPSPNFNGTYALEVFDDKLYIGHGKGGSNDYSRIDVYDGSSVAVSDCGACSASDKVYAFKVYQGKLYAGYGGTTISDKKIRVLTRSGASYVWGPYSNIPTDNAEEISSFGDFKGKLYIGQYDDAKANADIIRVGDSERMYSEKQSWNPNQWYHVAATWDQTSAIGKIYINGFENKSAQMTVTSVNASDNLLYIGNNHSDGQFSGTLDNVSIYNSAVSAADIASHAGCYNLGQYLVSEYMGALPIDPSSSIIDGSDTGYMISKDPGGVVTITAPLTETTSSIPEIIKASR